MSAPFSKKEAFAFLFEELPMFHIQGVKAYKPGLERVHTVLAALGNPEKAYKTIHIAGTNGKGSSAHATSSILQELGYKTGLFTSPHLVHFSERIRVGGIPISEEALYQGIIKVKAILDAENINLSFFEMSVILAFWHFKEVQVEWAVIEVGLGGRLDATNVIEPQACLLTNIGLDHQNILGDTLHEIAFEKAGILKKDTLCVVSEYQEEVFSVIKKQAEEKSAEIVFSMSVLPTIIQEPNQTIYMSSYEDKILIPSSMANFLCKNIRGVLSLFFEMNKRAILSSTPDFWVSGIQKIYINTGLRGRWEKVSTSPVVYLDVAHNAEGVKQILTQIPIDKKVHWVWGMSADKERTEIWKMLPKSDTYYFGNGKNPRLAEGMELFLEAQRMGFSNIYCYNSITEAYLAALKHCKEEEWVVVGGSFFLVSEILPHL